MDKNFGSICLFEYAYSRDRSDMLFLFLFYFPSDYFLGKWENDLRQTIDNVRNMLVPLVDNI